MDSFELKLDRDIARSFLYAPTNTISYKPIHMRNEQNHLTSSIDYKENLSNNFIPQPHPNAQLGYSTNKNLIPMYYDLIIDTVTDYDIFYPIAKQTKKYYYSNLNHDNENFIYPRDHIQNFDEHALSMDFTHDYDSISNWSNSPPPVENQSIQYEQLQPIKNVRFNDIPTWIPYSTNNIKNTSIPIDQYYFHPETIPSSIRHITTPFFWFRPVHDHNYAICIPTSRPSLHAYITSSFDSTIPNPIRL